MEYFEKYSSNTYAGSGNQHFFTMNEGEVSTGRVFYKISVGGKYNYSLLFSNILDSTFADGSESHKNLVCDSWKIHSAKVGKCTYIAPFDDVENLTLSDETANLNTDIVVSDLTEVTFNGNQEKEVMPGEFFSSDPVELEFESGEYLCLEMTFSGKMIPYHEESLLPVFVKKNGKWKYSRLMPFAGMIGCDRKVDYKVAYLGDSITQGIGTKHNSYKHWNALLSQKLGERFAFWNLGIGYGRASDAATDSAWLYKAKQNDVIFICFGVNDIFRGSSAEQIINDLTSIIKTLKKHGLKIILQTIPPFNYQGDLINLWETVNEYIKTILVAEVDMVFDVVEHIGVPGERHMAGYGDHPKEEGCRIWADALYDKVKEFFAKL